VDDILKRLGQRIREIRIQRGFASQEAFADYCKMHRTFLGHLETGRKDFRLTTIVRVADALGITLSELFAGVENGEPFKSKGVRRGILNHNQVRRELEILERSVRNLKELALPDDAHSRNAAGKSVRVANRRTSPRPGPLPQK
jgi:transcriptional regulator with XRE-family HTH domain